MLSDIARTVLSKRYLIKDDQGRPTETPEDLLRRVAKAVAAPETLYRRAGDVDNLAYIENYFYDMMAEGRFLPNSPTLMNAGRPLGQLSACFVLPVEDDLSSIYDTLKNQALIHQSGGGTGFSFSRLRPKGDIVRSTTGVASGPVSFMEVYNHSTEAIKQGGTRRGANMGILAIDHPDILEFITCKHDTSKITNFNISVAITDDFMLSVERDSSWHLISPTEKNKPLGQQETWIARYDFTWKDKKYLKAGQPAIVRARDLFDLIVECAHATGEPGLFFIDRANEFNPVPSIGRYEATNPCGEQPLLSYDVCNLGSINLGRYVEHGQILLDELEADIAMAVRFLDNVIDANVYPIPEITNLSKKIRRIGLGVMGWADMLIRLAIPYNSRAAVGLARDMSEFFEKKALKASEDLGRERGLFPEWSNSIWGPDDKNHSHQGQNQLPHLHSGLLSSPSEQ
jgi:ribonucleoside-diphosphate reductase alpha chain